MRHVKDIQMYLRLLNKSEQFNCLILLSEPGWGKSSTVVQALEELKEDYISIGSYSTPVNFYNALVQHSDKTLVLDDCAGLFDNDPARSLLKAATWPADGKRGGDKIVSWGTSAGVIMAPEVIFKGRLILLTNHMPGKNQHIRAFKNRSYLFEMTFTKEEKAELLLEAAKNKKYFEKTRIATDVAKHLIKAFERTNHTEISLRTLGQGYDIASSLPGRWQYALDRLLPKISEEDLIQKLHTAGGPVTEQEREYMRLTGATRRTFHRKRASLGLSDPTRQAGQAVRYGRVS